MIRWYGRSMAICAEFERKRDCSFHSAARRRNRSDRLRPGAIPGAGDGSWDIVIRSMPTCGGLGPDTRPIESFLSLAEPSAATTLSPH